MFSSGNFKYYILVSIHNPWTSGECNIVSDMIDPVHSFFFFCNLVMIMESCHGCHIYKAKPIEFCQQDPRYKLPQFSQDKEISYKDEASFIWHDIKKVKLNYPGSRCSRCQLPCSACKIQIIMVLVWTLSLWHHPTVNSLILRTHLT